MKRSLCSLAWSAACRSAIEDDSRLLGQAITKLQAPEGIRYLALFLYAPGEVPAIPIGNQDQSYHFGHALAALHAAADIWSMSINLVKGPIDGFECFDDGFFDSRLTWLRESVAIYRGMGHQRATDPS